MGDGEVGVGGGGGGSGEAVGQRRGDSGGYSVAVTGQERAMGTETGEERGAGISGLGVGRGGTAAETRGGAAAMAKISILMA